MKEKRYIYSPYGPYGLYRASVPVQGCTLPLLFIHIWYVVKHHPKVFIPLYMFKQELQHVRCYKNIYILRQKFYEDDRICPNLGCISVTAKKKKKKKRNNLFEWALGFPYLWVPMLYILLLHGSSALVSDTTYRNFNELTLQIMKSNINALGHAVTHLVEEMRYNP